jgi:hypothetical protein
MVVCLGLWLKPLRSVFCETQGCFASYSFRCSRCTASSVSSSPIPGGEVWELLEKTRDAHFGIAKAIPWLGGSS